MELLEIFKAARELIIDPARWTQGTPAKRADGSNCSARDELAVCFCLYGAFVKVSREVVNDYSTPFLGCIPEQYNFPRKEGANFIRFNDENTHADVIQALDCVIAKLEAKA